MVLPMSLYEYNRVEFHFFFFLCANPQECDTFIPNFARLSSDARETIIEMANCFNKSSGLLYIILRSFLHGNGSKIVYCRLMTNEINKEE